ncbi:hypothetical protein SISSUDRAFT_1061729 [Sistotremastrum suecicum HHB10207 ss-3]|uniref:Uncharacterized protein n=1 Tax=Sistotremastrum suecicum HHB10207 ss-3 TaxID=1314776 RepID=A0A166DMH8_9AGAM|nr:hypothetical protein SISSUDRAFT_1061729 [Sistotremastrum suecicum HHB10207 ss-3]
MSNEIKIRREDKVIMLMIANVPPSDQKRDSSEMLNQVWSVLSEMINAYLMVGSVMSKAVLKNSESSMGHSSASYEAVEGHE